MPIPQVTERLKEAPALALRALFAGIGQVLLTAEKVRTRALDQIERSRSITRPSAASSSSTTAATATAGRTDPRPATQPESAAVPVSDAGLAAAVPEPAAQPEAGAQARPGAPAKRPPGKPRATTKPADGKRPGAKPRAPGKPAPTPLPTRKQAAPAPPASDAPPIPGYDGLSVASLRARLRVLDEQTLRAMLAYERAHGQREPVIAMFERRLAKMGGEEN